MNVCCQPSYGPARGGMSPIRASVCFVQIRVLSSSHPPGKVARKVSRVLYSEASSRGAWEGSAAGARCAGPVRRVRVAVSPMSQQCHTVPRRHARSAAAGKRI